MKFTFQAGDRPLDGVTIKRAIHRGGFGEVYFARTDAGKEIALKLLHDNTEVELRGVTQCLNLSNPQLVTIFDIKTDSDGDHWILMEYVPGQTLAEAIDSHPGPMSSETVAEIISQTTTGLSFLHQRGLVHRDLKPANLFWNGTHLKIGDVGLSKFITVSQRSAQTQSVGTVYYMAPEVARGRYGTAVDIYAVGVIAFEMLTGDVPFNGESTGEILMKHLTQEPDLSGLSPEVRPVIKKALEKEESNRYQSIEEFNQDLQVALGGEAPEVKSAAVGTETPIEDDDGVRIAYSNQNRGSESNKSSNQHLDETIGSPFCTPNSKAKFGCDSGPPEWLSRFIPVMITVAFSLFFIRSGRLTLIGGATIALLIWGGFTALSQLRKFLNKENRHLDSPQGNAVALPVINTVDHSQKSRSFGSGCKAIATVPILSGIISAGILFFSRNFFSSKWSPDGYDWGHIAFFVSATTLATWMLVFVLGLLGSRSKSTSGSRIGLICAGILTGVMVGGLDQWFLVQYPHVIFSESSRGVYTHVGRHELAGPEQNTILNLESLAESNTEPAEFGSVQEWVYDHSTEEESGSGTLLPVSHMVTEEGHYDSSHDTAAAAEAQASASNDEATYTAWSPTLFGYAIFFGCLFGFRAWPKLANPNRTQRLYLSDVFISICLAYVACQLFTFPLSWGMTWAAAITAVTQMVTPARAA